MVDYFLLLIRSFGGADLSLGQDPRDAVPLDGALRILEADLAASSVLWLEVLAFNVLLQKNDTS
jgi:hypothetical protein